MVLVREFSMSGNRINQELEHSNLDTVRPSFVVRLCLALGSLWLPVW
jgi:hypothetical protein